MPTITISVLLIIVASLSAILSLITVALFYQKRESNKATRKQQRYIEKYKNDWYEFLINGAPGSVAMIPKYEPDFDAVENILLSYLKNYHTKKTTIRIYDFANEYLASHYEKQLRARKWSTKMHALYRIYDFRISQLLPQCEQLALKELDDDMFLQLLKIYALLKPTKFYEFVIAPSRHLPEIDFKQLFMIVEAHSLANFAEQFEQLPFNAQVALIDTIGLSQNANEIPLLVRLLQNDNVEIRIRALKALEQLKHIFDLTIYEPFATSPIWEERMMVAKILRHFPIEESMPLLEVLLEDPHYQVRYEASHTFTNVRNGERWIEQFLQTSTDPYAIDMVKTKLKQKVLT